MIGRIDVHHHFFPPAYLAAAGAEIAKDAPDMARILGWTPVAALDEMDRVGIDCAILSIPPPCAALLAAGPAAALARACNDDGAMLVADHAGRFRQFAMLPLPHVDAALAEIAYAYDVLHVDGVAVLTHYGDAWLGDPRWAPVFEELDARAAIVHVHPVAARVQAQVPAAVMEFPFDTTRAIAGYVFSGAAMRYPRIRMIFSHSGGALASIASRLIAFGGASPAAVAAAPDGVAAALRRFWYDVTFSALPAQIAALRAFVPDTQLLFGSDAPFMPAQRTVDQMMAGDGLPDARRAAIDRGNAARLFGFP